MQVHETRLDFVNMSPLQSVQFVAILALKSREQIYTIIFSLHYCTNNISTPTASMKLLFLPESENSFPLHPFSEHLLQNLQEWKF